VVSLNLAHPVCIRYLWRVSSYRADISWQNNQQ